MTQSKVFPAEDSVNWDSEPLKKTGFTVSHNESTHSETYILFKEWRRN